MTTQQQRRRDLHRRARRVVLSCGIVLALSPVIGGWLVDHCPLHIRFPEAARVFAAWEKAKPPPNILLLGSSRLASFVRQSELTATTNQLAGSESAVIFNSTITACEPITMEFLTRRLLGKKDAPLRLAVLESNADLLARENFYFKAVITRELTAADLPRYLGDMVLDHDALSRLLASRVTPFFLHRGHFLEWAGEVVRRLAAHRNQQTDSQQPPRLAKNTGLDDPETTRTAPAEQLRIALHRFETRLRHYELRGATSSALESTVAMLRARGCAVVLVQTPLSSAHRAFYSSDILRQFDDFVQRLHRVYGCEFVDYSDRLPDNCFSDNHHGNDAGSSEFTRLLARDVVAPRWRSVKPQTGE